MLNLGDAVDGGVWLCLLMRSDDVAVDTISSGAVLSWKGVLASQEGGSRGEKRLRDGAS